jgi:hydrogenase nickel incorporation protein HypA/HybF
MHEMALIQSMLDIVEEEMKRHQLDKLKAIHLAVGLMTAVVPEQMNSCFEILTQNTWLAGAELKMRMVPITYKCRGCSREYTAEGFAFECPSCKEANPELIAGRDLQIEFLEALD